VFYAGATSLSIVINPNFDAAIQAFSGATCPGLTTIGCVDAGANNATETLNLTSLTIGQRVYFRVFGATNSAANRTGTWTFCGTSSTLLQFALPVTLSSFSANAEKTSVEVKWTTASEIDHSHFEIERSSDSHPFQTTASIEPKGSTSSTASYTWRDLSPDPGMNYYRLKIVDLNGRYTYSSTVPVKVDYVKDIVLVQNPVSDRLVIQSRQSVQAFIFNSAGQQLLTPLLKPGRNEIALPALATGIYYLKTGIAGSTPEKFVVSQ